MVEAQDSGLIMRLTGKVVDCGVLGISMLGLKLNRWARRIAGDTHIAWRSKEEEEEEEEESLRRVSR